MTEKEIKKVNTVSTTSLTVEVLANQQTEQAKKLTKITGTLTSPIQLRGEGCQEPYYYSFIRLKGQNIDLPVIFKIKQSPDLFVLTGSVNLKPILKKSDEIELTGNYSNSNKNIRKSFTVYSYQLLNEKRIKKKCIGCCDTFTCYQSQNYDYCRDCELNGSRYIPGRFTKSKCPECGDGSGIIKFPNQPPRSCKLCYLAQQEKGEDKFFTKND